MVERFDPDVGGELAGRAMSAAHRRRLRRFAWLGSAGVVLACAATVTLLLDSGASDGTGGSDDVSDRAEIYAAALVHGGYGEPGAGPSRVIRIAICETVDQQPAGEDCNDGQIPIEVQRQVCSLVDVQFVEHIASPQRPGDSAIIVFGALSVQDDHAMLGMEYLCGPLCGQGQTLILAKTDGTWRVTGTTGPAWIS
jgi:hypothetical protein